MPQVVTNLGPASWLDWQKGPLLACWIQMLLLNSAKATNGPQTYWKTNHDIFWRRVLIFWQQMGIQVEVCSNSGPTGWVLWVLGRVQDPDPRPWTRHLLPFWVQLPQQYSIVWHVISVKLVRERKTTPQELSEGYVLLPICGQFHYVYRDPHSMQTF